MRRPVDERDADAQAPQQRDVQEQVREVVVLDHRAVDGDDERPVAKARDVPQNLAEIGQAEHGSAGSSFTSGMTRI